MRQTGVPTVTGEITNASEPLDCDLVEVNPLLPADIWDYFCLDGVPYHGRMLTVLYDKTGKR